MGPELRAAGPPGLGTPEAEDILAAVDIPGLVVDNQLLEAGDTRALAEDILVQSLVGILAGSLVESQVAFARTGASALGLGSEWVVVRDTQFELVGRVMTLDHQVEVHILD